MTNYNIVAASGDMTVMSEYIPEPRKQTEYQSEADLEQELINNLISQGIPHLTIPTEEALINNLRTQLEKLNNCTFAEEEWEGLKSIIFNPTYTILDKTRLIQQDYIQEVIRLDGSTMNVRLIDKDNIHRNSVQVINQYTNQGTYENRYDVTILVNGFPMIQIELKRRGVAIKEAFNQINRYQKDSFWAGCGLYEYIQIFVISNGTNTKYYSNTTRNAHIKEMQGIIANKKRTSNSFKFTSYWADANNRVLTDLVDFTKTFLTKATILNIITKYCVLTAEDLLLVMRPYQIAATERVLNKILISSNYKKQGTIEACAYIWHTTGSGKTLTSFKTAQLASQLPQIDKVLFVVDRKDLDYQTMKEYDKFEKGAANSNKSTRILQRQLENDNCRIIITTIQKLSTFVKKNQSHPIYNKNVIMIFDECHRSQFGDMHDKIIKSFKKYYLFGFTGTPIYAKNAVKGKNPFAKTTAQLFGQCLHTYTIVDAINDENVLPFRIDYINTIKENIKGDKAVEAIDTEKALMDDRRIEEICKYIIEHFDQKTRRNKTYSLKGQRVNGFNSLFAVDSIPMAIKYYQEMKKQLALAKKDLTIAMIYSFNPNEEDPDDIFADEDFEMDKIDQSSRDCLEDAIRDYNIKFHTNYNTSGEEFQNYYKDVSQRMKDREIDMLIVVNMFLTGFDATTLNTLWVDKNLKLHGLIQAFSRTNRILNSVKTYGNIVCFRNLEKETEEAIALFGDKNAQGIVILKSFKDYYEGYTDDNGKYYKGYRELIEELGNKYPLGVQIIGEENRKEFVKLFGAVLRIRNVLVSFDDFDGKEILSTFDFQDYQSNYLDIYNEIKEIREKEKEDINQDLEFEIELIKQVEINIDYILQLIKKYHDSNCENKEILISINKTIDSSLKLRSKKDLINDFIGKVNNNNEISEEWKHYVADKKEKELNDIIVNMKLKPELTHQYMENSFKDGSFKTFGVDFDKILPSVSLFGGKRKSIKEKVIEVLTKFFEKYFDI